MRFSCCWKVFVVAENCESGRNWQVCDGFHDLMVAIGVRTKSVVGLGHATFLGESPWPPIIYS